MSFVWSLNARSNRQLTCSGEGCDHVYRQPKPYKKSKKNAKCATNAPTCSSPPIDDVFGPDWSKNDLDFFFDIFGAKRPFFLDEIPFDLFDSLALSEDVTFASRNICV